MHLPASAIAGLVWAYHLHEGNVAARALRDEEMRALPETGFFWFHFSLADTRLPTFLESLDILPEAALVALTTHETHPSVNVDEGYVYGTLVDYQRDFDQSTREIGFLHYAVFGRFIVTTRLHPLASVDSVRFTLEKAPAKFDNPIDIFEQLVADFQRSLFGLVREITADLNVIEDAVYSNRDPLKHQKQLQPLRRSIVRLHRHLRTLLTAMRHAASADEDEMPEGFADVSARSTSRLEAAGHEVDALQERARLLHEEINSVTSNETNRHVYVMSVMTALLLPPTLVTGFFGMNTAGLPFQHDDAGTFWAFGAIGGSVLLAWWLLRRVGIF